MTHGLCADFLLEFHLVIDHCGPYDSTYREPYDHMNNTDTNTVTSAINVFALLGISSKGFNSVTVS